jgi:hypothetical protein
VHQPYASRQSSQRLGNGDKGGISRLKLDGRNHQAVARDAHSRRTLSVRDPIGVKKSDQ